MKRMHIALLAAAAGYLCMTSDAAAQLGMNIFKKPNIADIFKPVVGTGALYEQQRTGGQKGPTQMEMSVVGRELTDGQEGYWVQFGMQQGQPPRMIYSKVLVTREFQMKRIVFQQPGQPAMEMPFNPTEKTNSYMKEEMEKWHNVGPDTITVPAGTFLCQHWKKDAGVGDAWVSDKITPMSLVKSVNSGDTMVLVKTLTGVTDHITGPVTKFDPQLLRQQMMQQTQKPQQ
jgi:hypothetical protein